MTDKNFEALRYAAQAVIDEAGEGWFGEDHPLQETDSFDELAPVPMVDMRHIARTSPRTILAMLAHITELEEQIATEPLREDEGNRDTARINWLAKKAGGVGITRYRDGVAGPIRYDVETFDAMAEGDTLREAIDNAMEIEN